MMIDLTESMSQACENAADAVEEHPSGLHREPRYLLRKAAEVLRTETSETRRNGLLLIYGSLVGGAYMAGGSLAANAVFFGGAFLFGVRMVLQGWSCSRTTSLGTSPTGRPIPLAVLPPADKGLRSIYSPPPVEQAERPAPSPAAPVRRTPDHAYW